MGGQQHDPELPPDAPALDDGLDEDPDGDPDGGERSEAVGRRTRRTWLIAAGVFVAMALVAGAAAYAVGLARAGVTSSARAESPVSQVPGSNPSASLESPAAGDATPQTPYALDAAGLTGFLQAYRDRFDTSEVLDLTLYDAYAIVDVAVPGQGQQQGWSYRDGLGWTRFGGPRATAQGVAPIDTDRIEVGALQSNLALGRRTLGVPNPSRASVVLLAPTGAGAAPTLEIHVSNDFDQEGVLRTALDGRVLGSTTFLAPSEDQSAP